MYVCIRYTQPASKIEATTLNRVAQERETGAERFHERETGAVCAVAGDFNAREGEDDCMRAEGWHDAWIDVQSIDADLEIGTWTWKRGINSARFDRFYTRACGSDSVSCLRVDAIRSVWEGGLTDHLALHAILRRTSGAVVVRSNAGGARVDVAEGCEGSGLVPECAAKSSHDPPTERAESCGQRQDIPVVKIANAITGLDNTFRTQSKKVLELP